MAVYARGAANYSPRAARLNDGATGMFTTASHVRQLQSFHHHIARIATGPCWYARRDSGVRRLGRVTFVTAFRRSSRKESRSRRSGASSAEILRPDPHPASGNTLRRWSVRVFSSSAQRHRPSLQLARAEWPPAWRAEAPARSNPAGTGDCETSQSDCEADGAVGPQEVRDVHHSRRGGQICPGGNPCAPAPGTNLCEPRFNLGRQKWNGAAASRPLLLCEQPDVARLGQGEGVATQGPRDVLHLTQRAHTK